MNLEQKLKELRKFEKKKKWDDAVKVCGAIADYYTEIMEDYPEALKYMEQAIELRQKTKRAGATIQLYRKTINIAKKGKRKTQRELFRHAASAIPIIEEYIKVLTENNEYITKNGAMTRYFLGECREIVSGINSRNTEYLLSGKVFVEVGKRLALDKKTQSESEEAFEKSRIIFSLMKNDEEIFESLLAEADLCIRKLSLDRGFHLFDEARNIFEDETHTKTAADIEKGVYAEVGLSLLRNYYRDMSKRNISDSLISRARTAHLEARTLAEVSQLLLEIGAIHLEHKNLDAAFQVYDEAIVNSQTVYDESIPKKIIETLYEEGKKKAEELIQKSSKLRFDKVEDLLPIKFHDEISKICKKLEITEHIQEVAISVREMGKKFKETKLITDDFPFIEKATKILITHNQLGGLQKIGDELEDRIELMYSKRNMGEVERLRSFLANAYLQMNDMQAVGWLNSKVAGYHAQLGDHERQLALIGETIESMQQADPTSVKSFSDSLEAQFPLIKATSFQRDFISLLGNVYLLAGETDKYDSLYSQQALFLLENDQIDEALSLFNMNFEYLRRIKYTTRAINRSNEMIDKLLEKNQYIFVISLFQNQVNLLVTQSVENEEIIPAIQKLENQLNLFLEDSGTIPFVEPIFSLITTLYDYIGIKEAQGDVAFEISSRFFELDLIDQGFDYLDKSFFIFHTEEITEKIGLILDFIVQKKAEISPENELDPVSDRFSDFLITCLIIMKQDAEAAKLMLERAIQLLPQDEEKSFGLFTDAKSILSKVGTPSEVAAFNQEFGSVLLKYGKTDRGIDILSTTTQKTSVDSLSMADTYLTSAKHRFDESDFDAYFNLVDKALNIYSELEMLTESSSIALAEARRLWSVKNIAYTIIFLERSWEPLTRIFSEDVSQSITPIIQVLNQVVDDLFAEKRYDEALGFMELQERIYQHINRTDLILTIEKKKVEAHIGKESYELGLNQLYDLANLGLEDGKINETVTLMRDFLPIFVDKIPLSSLDLFKLYFHALVKSTGPDSQIMKDNITNLIRVIFNSLTSDNKEKFSQQVVLLTQGFSEIPNTQSWLVFFFEEVIQHLIKEKYYVDLLILIKENLFPLENTEASLRYSFIQKIAPLFNNKNIPEESTISFVNFVFTNSKTLNDEQKGIVASILDSIGDSNKRRKRVRNFANDRALALSQAREDSKITFNLLVSRFQREYEAEEYGNSLEILDNVIQYIEREEEPQKFATQIIDQLEEILQTLTNQRKKRWLDLFTYKYQQISDRFL